MEKLTELCGKEVTDFTDLSINSGPVKSNKVNTKVQQKVTLFQVESSKKKIIYQKPETKAKRKNLAFLFILSKEIT